MNFVSQFMLMSSAIIAASPNDDEQVFTTPGVYSWIAPTKVKSVSVITMGGGATPVVSALNFPGGGGGGLAYGNNMQVIPGVSYTVVVGSGGNSSGSSTSQILGSNGENSSFSNGTITITSYGGLSNGVGGTYSGTGGGSGGSSSSAGSGGGGAGGYSGNGGNGGAGGSNSIGSNGTSGSGGAGGGGGGSFSQSYLSSSAQPGRSSSGGGTGIFGQGSNGLGGNGATGATPIDSASPSGGGSGGTSGDLNGGLYGGGGRSGFVRFGSPTLFLAGGSGANGVVRIIWPGNARSFPSINTQEI